MGQDEANAITTPVQVSVTRSLWMKPLASRCCMPSLTSRLIDSKDPKLKLPRRCLRKFSRQPCSMNSVTM